MCYQLAVVNGAPDGGNGPDLDTQSEKDYVGRLFFHPLRPTKIGALANLGLGLAASFGQAKGTNTAPGLPTYRTTGQQPMFSYIVSNATPDATTLAAGNRWRVAPQFYWYIGPVGLMAEYLLSSQQVTRTGNQVELRNQAWNLSGSFVLTMEKSSYEGVIPKRPVDFRHANFGALELTLRYSELRIDQNAFPNFADPTVSVQSAREFGGGLNWYLTENVAFMFSFHRIDFVGGALAGGNREEENAFLGRLQLTL
jgi:phosphate-selective porin OprO/OprP